MIALTYVPRTNSFVQFMTALLVFVFVVLLTRFSIKWVGKLQKVNSNNKNMEIIETLKLAPNQFAQIIKVGERYFLIGIGKEETTYFAELSEHDLELKPSEEAPQDSFQQLLNKAKERIHKRSDGNE